MRTGSPFGIVSGVCGPALPSPSGRSIIGTIVAGALGVAGLSTSRVGSLGAFSTGWGTTTPSRSNTTGKSMLEDLGLEPQPEGELEPRVVAVGDLDAARAQLVEGEGAGHELRDQDLVDDLEGRRLGRDPEHGAAAGHEAHVRELVVAGDGQPGQGQDERVGGKLLALAQARQGDRLRQPGASELALQEELAAQEVLHLFGAELASSRADRHADARRGVLRHDGVRGIEDGLEAGELQLHLADLAEGCLGLGHGGGQAREHRGEECRRVDRSAGPAPSRAHLAFPPPGRGMRPVGQYERNVDVRKG